MYAIRSYYEGEYYNEDATKSALDSDEAINAFKTYCEYYTEYKLDKETSVEQRFRTGEAPIIIADYTVYNNFQVSAPDIKGLWGFAPVPGTAEKDENGNYVYDENGDFIINNTIGSSGQACVLMEASDEKEAGWEFLKWWTSEDTQTLYGRDRITSYNVCYTKLLRMQLSVPMMTLHLT